jgi:predicted nucleic acid-binding protein
MSFLLDTNIVSFHLKRPRGLMHRFVQYAGRLVYDLTMVTHNTADFQNIPGLRLDDWLTP